MKSIAIISFHHPESTLPLVKYLAEKDLKVDYYFITFFRMRSVSGFDFGGRLMGLGIKKLSRNRIAGLYSYMSSDFVNIHLIGLWPFTPFFFINKYLLKLAGRKICRKKYDVINFVGQDRLLVHLHRAIQGTVKFHTLHEVADHTAGGKKQYNDLQNYLVNNKIPIIVHSNASYSRLIKNSRFQNIVVKSIPFGLFETYSLFKARFPEIKNKKNIILFYGMISPYKGLSVLTEAVKILKKNFFSDFIVVVAGNGHIPAKEILEKDENYLIINRYISNEELVALNMNAKVVVCPYTSASQSGIVMTSFLFGKPIIASDVGAFREVISDNYNGLLIPPNSPEDLAANITKLFNDEPLYDTLCKNVAKFGQSSRFNWREIAELTIKTYFNQ